MKFADFLLRGWGGGGVVRDILYAFFGNVVRGKSALFRLVVRNGFVHFIRKVLAHRKLLPGNFWVFVPLHSAWYIVHSAYPRPVVDHRPLSPFAQLKLRPIAAIGGRATSARAAAIIN